jgi:hypothetical protein
MTAMVRFCFERDAENVLFTAREVVLSTERAEARRPRHFTLTMRRAEFPVLVERALRVRYAHRDTRAEGSVDGDLAGEMSP